MLMCSLSLCRSHHSLALHEKLVAAVNTDKTHASKRVKRRLDHNDGDRGKLNSSRGAMYSTSVDERATQPCFFVFQLTAPPPILNRYALTERQLSQLLVRKVRLHAIQEFERSKSV